MLFTHFAIRGQLPEDGQRFGQVQAQKGVHEQPVGSLGRGMALARGSVQHQIPMELQAHLLNSPLLWERGLLSLEDG
jgi:hypothetical protein